MTGIIVCATFIILAGMMHGCVFLIDHLVPAHGNVGDRLVLRNPNREQPLPEDLRVLFENTPCTTLLRQTPEEIVVEVPPGLVGSVQVSVWQGLFIVSNIKPYRVDLEPIAYRILAFGDSLMGPWVYHPQKLDRMLNETVGPSLVINEGKAGETLSQGAERLVQVLSTHLGVEYIYVLEGANDVADIRNTPLEEMLGALDQMMDLASTHAVYPILLTLPPRAGNSLLYDQTPPTTESWNEALRSYAISNGYEWIDLYQAFLNQPDWESLLDDGGLHLSQEGQVFVAETVYSVLAPLLE